MRLAKILEKINRFIPSVILSFLVSIVFILKILFSDCDSCGETEHQDMRFLPCTKFASDFNCSRNIFFIRHFV